LLSYCESVGQKKKKKGMRVFSVSGRISSHAWKKWKAAKKACEPETAVHVGSKKSTEERRMIYIAK